MFVLLLASLASLCACSDGAEKIVDGDQPGESDGDESAGDYDLADGDGESLETDTESAIVIPSAPASLTATVVSARNVRLNWEPYSDEAVRVCIQRSEFGGEYKDIACRPGTYGRWLDLALTPLSEYKYRAQACFGEDCSESVETEKVVTPETELPEFEVTVSTYDDPDEVFVMSITNILNQDTYAAVAAIRRDGTVLWEMIYSDLCPITEIDPFKDDHTLAVGAFGTLRVIDLDGSINYEYPPDLAHHDFDKLSNGNIIYLIFDQIKQSEDYTILGDGIHIINPFTDEIVWEWMGKDYIPLTDNNPNDMSNIWFGVGHDWTHSNSVWFDEANNYIYLNVRNLNRIYKIKYPSGDVEWIMGDGGDFGEGIWSHSHDPKYIDPNHILMFDNGLFRPSGGTYSQTILLEYDENARTAEVVWRYREDPDFFSLGLGSVDYTANGNVATCDGANGRIVEVNEAGEKQFELKFETLFVLYKALPVETSYFTEWGAPAIDYGWPRETASK